MIDSNFILLVCFIGFTAIAFKIGYKKSLSGLDQKIADISKTVETTRVALIQAQETHRRELEYRTNIAKEISEMIQQSHRQIEEIKQQAQIDLEMLMENKTQNAKARIEGMGKEVILELNEKITNKAVQTLNLLFATHLSEKTQKKINDHFLNELDQLLKQDRVINQVPVT